MAIHSHHFVETYNDLIGMGYNRETDEKTVIFYLQKFSDDSLLKAITPRLSDMELNEIFVLLNRLMKTHLSDTEYHHLFLKDRSDE